MQRFLIRLTKVSFHYFDKVPTSKYFFTVTYTLNLNEKIQIALKQYQIKYFQY